MNIYIYMFIHIYIHMHIIINMKRVLYAHIRRRRCRFLYVNHMYTRFPDVCGVHKFCTHMCPPYFIWP